MSLLEDIKELRARDASDFSEIIRLGLLARDAVQRLDPTILAINHSSGDYLIYKRRRGRKDEYTRPVSKKIYVSDTETLKKIIQNSFDGDWNPSLSADLEKAIYTIVQDVACYLDFFDPRGARKAVGTFFEGVIASVINRVTNQTVLSGTTAIPGIDSTLRIDLSVSDPEGILLLVATKTSTRERLSQPFVQALISSRVLKQDTPAKSILIVLGDVQRKETNSTQQIQHTFTAGQFPLYSEHVFKLDGTYYFDIPPQAASLVSEGLMKPFSSLLLGDLSGFVTRPKP